MKLIQYVFMIMILVDGITFSQNVMVVHDTSGIATDTITVRMSITNDSMFVAFQTDIELPTGFIFIPNSAILSTRKTDHTVSASVVNGNKLRIIAFSFSQSSFTGSNGDVLTFRLKLAPNSGEYQLTLQNSIISGRYSNNILTGVNNGMVAVLGPEINLSPAHLNYGRVPLNSSGSQSFTVYNLGNTALTVSRIYTGSEYFRVVGDTTFTLQPLQSQLITINFLSQKKGVYSSQVYIKSDDPDEPVSLVSLEATSFAVNELRIVNSSGRSGYPIRLDLKINNMEPFTGFQFDLVLPDALTYIPGSVLLSARKSDQIVSANVLQGNRLRVIAFSATNSPFTGSDGNVVSLGFNLEGAGGDYPVNLDSVIVTDISGVNIVSGTYSGNVSIIAPDISGNSILDMGEVINADTLYGDYTFNNVGSDTLFITSISSPDISFINLTSLPLSIPQGQSSKVRIKFHNLNRGLYQSRIMVRTNDSDEDPFYFTAKAISFIPNYIVVKDTIVFSGDTAKVALHIKNAEEIVAFQVDVRLPDSVKFISDGFVKTDRLGDHSVNIKYIGNNTVRIFAFSLNQSAISGSDGPVGYFKFKVGSITGVLPLQLSEGILSDRQSRNVIKATVDGNLRVYPRPQPPILTFPGNNGENIFLPVQFTWQNSINAISHQFQLFSDSLMQNKILDTVIESGLILGIPVLHNSSRYFWRVRGKSDGGFGEWSNLFSFITVIEKPTATVLVSPVNNSNGLQNPIVAKWNKSLRVEKYKMQVSTDNLFTSFIVNDSTLTDTTNNLPNLDIYAQYYWRVKAVNVGGESDWSTVWNFKTLGNPYASNLIVPLDASVNHPPNGLRFRWTKAQERIETIQKYQLQVSTDSLFAITFVNDSTLTDTTKVVGGMGYLTKYFWRVRAQNQTGWGDWSATWKFTTLIEKPPVPVMVIPANNTLGLIDPVTFKWNKSLRVEKYAVQLSRTEAFDQVFFSGETFDTLKIYTSTIAPLLPNTRYYWRVRATNIGGTSEWTTGWTFKMLGNPYASVPLQPTNQSVNQSINGLTFKWTKAQERIETIQKYQLQLSTDSLFSTFFINDTTLIDTSRIVNGFSYLTKYFWRVRAQNQTGWGDWSNTWQFITIIEKPTISVLALPVNGDKGLLNPITAKWNKSLRVEKYKLQVSSNNLFSSFIVNDSLLTDTTRLLQNLDNYTQYYWRVKAVNVGGESDWSGVWNFKTLGNPYASNLIDPLNNSVNHPLNGLSFKWTKAQERIETIQKYQLQVSTDSLFTTTFVNDSTLIDTSRIVNGMDFYTKYFWRVRAQNQTGWGDWSNTWRFTTIIDKPTVPVLALPANGDKGLLNPITAKWNKSLRVEKYKLQVSVDNLFTSFILNDSTVTDTTKILPNLANYSQYYWRVKAVNVGGESDWSMVWNFKTLGNPYASNLLTPLDASVNQQLNGLTFKWTKATERIETIQKYQFQISTDSLFASTFVNDSTLTDTIKIVGGMAYLTKYFWRVRAQNQTGWGDWSNNWRFTTIIDKPTIPVLALPASGDKGLLNPITVQWKMSLRVEKYKLQVSTDNLFTSFIVNDSSLTDTTRLLPNLVNYTQYYWRVKAVNIGGESDWSAVWNFKTLGNPYASNLVQPLNNSVNQPLNGLTFRWTKAQERIESIQKYQFQVSTDSLFASTFVNDSTLTDTMKVVGGMGYLTNYFWRVRAQNQTGWGDWSETWKFATIIEKPTVPVLISPVNNSIGLQNPITAKWNKSLRIEKYRIQVSTDSLFGSLIVNDSTLTDTTKLLPEFANYSKYFWRVKAVNVGGESDWSAVWNFKTLGNPYTVTLASPENGVGNNPINSVTFKWFKPQERIETILKYHFQLSTDSLFGSISFSDSTFILDTTTTGSGLSHLTTYFWRVRAKNETGWGDWSQVWNLTTIIEKPSIPLLVSPANNVTQLLQPVVLKWRQSLRVEKYTLEVSEIPNFTTLFLVDSTLTDTMKTLPQLQNTKTWYWRVKARNIGGISEYSTVWNFRTLGLPLTLNLIAPLNGSINLPVNDVLFQWSTGGEQTLGSVTSGRKSIKKVVGDEESIGSPVGNNTPAGGNRFASGNANTTSGIESIGNYWLEIKTDTSNTTLFYSDSTLTDTTKLMSGFVFQTTYFWRVKANNEVGWGSFSGWFSFTTQKKPIATPTALTATATAVKRVTLSWSDNSDNELGFIILRKTGDSTSTATLERIDSVGVDITGFFDTTVTDTTYYSYKVMAYNADTLSEQSNYATVFTLTGIKEISNDIPKEFILYQNYPNPFNPSTIIRFALPKDAHVEIELYSIHGELMKKLVSEEKQAGYYEISLEIPSYASGIYFYRIVAIPGDRGEPFIQTRKFILMK